MKSKYMNKKYNLFDLVFIILSLILVSFIQMSIFFLVSNLFEIYNLSNELKNDYLYINSIQSLNQKTINYLPEDGAYYKFQYLEKEDDCYIILYTNSKGLEIGMPFFSEEATTLLKLNPNVPHNMILSNENLELCKGLNVNNIFYKLKYNIDYLYVDDELSIEQSDFVIFDSIPYSIEEKIPTYNEYSSTNFICSGECLKEQNYKWIEVEIYLVLAISLISLVVMLATLFNLISFAIVKDKDEILINYIYYKEEKNIKRQLTLKYGTIIISEIIICNLLFAGIFNFWDYKFLIMDMILFVIISIGFINIKISKLIKKIVRPNVWRLYDDKINY